MARIIAGFLTLLLALMHCSTVSAIVSCDTCESGRYYDGCNSCVCSTDGYAGCTLRGCMVQEAAYCEPVKEPSNANANEVSCDTCESGSYYDGCNSCTCSTDGFAMCTLRGCMVQEAPYCEPVKEPCSSICPFNGNFDLKCGSDGITYDNECKMEAAVCESSGMIYHDYDGPCVEVGPCHYVRCDSNTVCEVDDWGNAQCVGSDLLEPANEVVSCDTCESGSYNDGCNSCTCSTDGAAFCTRMGCMVQGVPYCKPVEEPTDAVEVGSDLLEPEPEPCVNIKSDKWCLKKVDKCDRKDKVRNNCQLTCGVCMGPCANIESDEWCLNKIDKCDNKSHVRDKCQATCGICQI